MTNLKPNRLFGITLGIGAATGLAFILGWMAPAQAYTTTEYTTLNVPGPLLFNASASATIFASNPGLHTVKWIMPADGRVLKTYSLDANFNPGKMVVLNGYLWVGDTNPADSAKLAKIDITNATATYYTVGSPATLVHRGITTDGTYIYVAGTQDRPAPQPDDERIFQVDQSGATVGSADEGGITCSGQPCENDTNKYLVYENSILGEPAVWSIFTESASGITTNNVKAYRTSNLVSIKNCQIGSGDPNNPVWETASLNGNYFDIVGSDDIFRRFSPNTCLSIASYTLGGLGTGVASTPNSVLGTTYFLVSNSGVYLDRFSSAEFRNLVADTARQNPVDLARNNNIFSVALANGNLITYNFNQEASLAITGGPTASPVGATTATVNWVTNPNTSQNYVDYGLTASYGTTVFNTDDNTNHAVGLSGLQRNTLYHYRVRSCNAFTCASSGDGTFSTLPPQPPTIAISNPTSNQVFNISGPITVQGSASDADGSVSEVHTRLCNPNCGTWGPNLTPPYSSWSTSNSPLTYGYNRIEAYAKDNENNNGYASVDIYYQAKPTVTITSHTDGQTVSSASITLSGTAADLDDNIVSMTVALNGGAPQAISITAGPNVSWSKALTLNQGANTVNVVATDAAGNTGNKQITINYTLQQPPVVHITSHTNDQHVTTSSIAISGTASDADNNIKTPMRVIVNGVSQNLTITQGQNVNWGPQTRTLNPGANVIRVEADDVSSPANTGFDQITVWYDVPDFTFAVTSTTPLTVQQGTNGAFTFTLTSINGFNALVDLSIQGTSPAIPASYMTWSADPISSGWTSPATSTLTINTASLVAQTYTITAQAVGGSLPAKIAVATLVVTGGPDFSLTVRGASSRTILPGAGALYDIQLTETVPVYDQNVTSSVQSISPTPPAGTLTTGFNINPVKPSPYSSGRPFFTVITTTGLTPGTYTFVVKAHNDILNVDRTVTLTLIVSAPNFTLDAYEQGNSPNEAISVQYTTIPGNYAIWDVKMTSVNNWGGDIDMSFSQPAILSGRSLIDTDPATLPAGGTVTPQFKIHYSSLATGSYTGLAVKGTSVDNPLLWKENGGLSLQVTTGADYQLTALPTTQNGTAGGSVQYTLNLKETTPVYNFPVSLTLDSVSGPTGSTPNLITADMATLPATATPTPNPGTNHPVTINIDSATASATYTLRFKGIGADSNPYPHFISVNLIVGAAPDFTLTAVPATQNGALGGTVQYTLNLKDLPDDSDVDYTGPVSLTLDSVVNKATNQPEPTITLGSLATPQSVTEDPGTNDVATINIGGTTPAGTYTLTFKGAGAIPLVREHTVQVELVISPADFDLYLSPAVKTSAIPGTATYTLYLKDVPDDNDLDYTWPVNLTLDSVVNTATGQAASGITLQNITTPQTPTEDPWNASSADISVAAGTVQAIYDLTFKGVGTDPTNLEHTYTVQLDLNLVPPVVSNINCTPGFTSITVTWQTNIAATGRLYYSPVDPPQDIVNESGSLKVNHSVIANNLTQNTDYYYQVESCNSAQTACSGRQPPAALICHTLSDAEPPVVQWVEPQDNATISGNVDLKVSATDNLAMSRVQFLVDGSPLAIDQAPADCNPLYCKTSWDTLTVSDGNHTLHATAFDEAGNSASASIVVTVQNHVVPPACSNINYTAGSTTAQIWWTTDINSDSRVYYCPETGANACGSCPGGYLGYYCQNKIKSESVTSHSVELTGLTANAYYHFTAVSCAGENNCGQCRR